jgi:hypothetical protein
LEYLTIISHTPTEFMASIDPLRDRDECWRWLELVDDFQDSSRGRKHEIQSRIHHLGLV